MRASQSHPVGQFLKLLPMTASAPHEEQEVQHVQDEADPAQRDPEQAAEDDAQKNGNGPEQIASHGASPEDQLVDMMREVALAGQEHPLLLPGV